MLFDWANQPFQTLIVTFIFAPWFVAEVVGDPVRGQTLWGVASAIGGATVAILAPLLGAMADRTGARKRWVLGFSVPYVLGCLGFWLATPDMAAPWIVLAFYVVAFVGSEFGQVFTNAMLPELGPRQEIGRISGSGWALGYARRPRLARLRPPLPRPRARQRDDAPRHPADLRPRRRRRRARPRHRPARGASGTSSSPCRSSSSPPTRPRGRRRGSRGAPSATSSRRSASPPATAASSPSSSPRWSTATRWRRSSPSAASTPPACSAGASSSSGSSASSPPASARSAPGSAAAPTAPSGRAR